nr:hypothetical protein [Micromonospora sp. DSM 115978]
GATGGAQTTVLVTAATTVTSCAAPSLPAPDPATAAPAAGGAGTADGLADGTTDAAPAAEEGDDLALLVLFPLIGAVAAAVAVATRRRPAEVQ